MTTSQEVRNQSPIFQDQNLPPQHILDTLLQMIEELGPEGVALGSGFDSFPHPLPIHQMALLSEYLVQQSVPVSTIAGVMGENVIRYFSRQLPVS